MAPLFEQRGKVCAVDAQPQMLRVIATAAKRPGLGNSVPVLGVDNNVKLAKALGDLAIMVDVSITNPSFRTRRWRASGVRCVPAAVWCSSSSAGKSARSDHGGTK